MRERLLARMGRLPRPLLLLGLGAGVALAFIAVVMPLFSNTGRLDAEVGGSLPSHLTAGTAVTLDVSIDNTGDSALRPVCLAADFSRTTRIEQVTFQGTDHVAFANGRACGGQLSPQETISLQLRMLVDTPGPLTVRLQTSTGAAGIGRALRGTIAVGP